MLWGGVPEGSSTSARSSFPFDRVGEELVYSMRWGPFAVGSGFLRVLPVQDVNGEPCYHLSLEVKTNSFADAFYKVRSRFDSFVSVEDIRPVRYRLNQREGKTRRQAAVSFDWQALTVSYHRDGEEALEPVAIEEETWDPLSVLYYFRQALVPGEGIVSLPASDGKKFLLIDVEHRGLVNLDGAMGRVSAMHVEPNTKEMRGVFQKSSDSNIQMWFSNDESKYPLRIRSKVVVGSFVAELQDVRMISEHSVLETEH